MSEKGLRVQAASGCCELSMLVLGSQPVSAEADAEAESLQLVLAGAKDEAESLALVAAEPKDEEKVVRLDAKKAGDAGAEYGDE